MRIAFTDFDVGLVCVGFCNVNCPPSFHALCTFTIDELRGLVNFVCLLLFIVSQFILATLHAHSCARFFKVFFIYILCAVSSCCVYRLV